MRSINSREDYKDNGKHAIREKSCYTGWECYIILDMFLDITLRLYTTE